MLNQELEQLRNAMQNTRDKRLYERYLSVLLHLEGRTYPEIAKIIGRTRQTVMNYCHAYEEGGISSLQMKKPTGKPEKLTEDQQKQLAETIINKTPAEVGFEAKYTWTLPLIADWIQREFQQSYTPRGVSKMLHRLGFSYTKATYTLAKADPEEQKAFKEVTFPKLKQQLENGIIDHLLFEDEAFIRAYQALQYNWFPKGQQRKIKTYGQHKGAKLFAAINYETGEITHYEEEKSNSLAFRRFVELILSKYPQGKIVMVLDNSKVHQSQFIKDFLKENPRMEFVFLPKYSPELNPVEGLWKWLKQDVVNNVFFSKFYQIRSHVAEFMKQASQKSQEVIDRLLVRLELSKT
ncbi:MAG: IS630 family transposase [Heyndrickxia faecalis]|jgi:transposase|uniref:IS630 family transposase n=1 Tax=Heyndrickxia TaxID=2837504 RepID=UPI00216438A6|nr:MULTISPECIES: IS630 family transposase [Heyndrickxia]MEC2342287.1 IS630 family transposase [Weizmannia sp. CD-2023]